MTVEQCAKIEFHKLGLNATNATLPSPRTLDTRSGTQSGSTTYISLLSIWPAGIARAAPAVRSGRCFRNSLAGALQNCIRCAAAACHPLCMQPRWHASSAPYPRLAPEAPPAVSTADDASQLIPQLFLQRIWYTGSSLEWAHAEPPRRLLCRRLVPAGRPDYLHQTQKGIDDSSSLIARCTISPCWPPPALWHADSCVPHSVRVLTSKL